MPIAQLSIDLVAKIAEFEANLKRATTATREQTKIMESAFSSVKKTIIGLAAGFTAGAFIEMIRGSIDAMDSLNDLSKTTGIAVEQLGGLKLAAKQSGGDLEGIAASINKLSVNMGKDPARFAALGVVAKQPLEAFKQLADIFSAIKDPQLRAALGAEALGKSWASAAPLLSEGGKAIQEMVDKGQRLSGITKEMAEKADIFNDRLAELETVMTRSKIKLADEMLPAMTNITKAMGDAYEEGGKLHAVWVAMGALGAFLYTDEFKTAAARMRDLNKELLILKETQKAQANTPAFGFVHRWLFGDNYVSSEIDQLVGKIAALQAQMDKPGNDAKTKREEDAKRAADAARADAAAKKAEAFIKENARKNADLVEQGRKLAESLLSQSAELSPDFYEKWNKLSVAYKGNAISLDRLILAQGELLNQQPFEKKALDAAVKAAEESQTARTRESAEIDAFQRERLNNEDKFWRDLLAATPSAQLDKRTESMLKIYDGFTSGRYGATDSPEALDKYTEVIQTFLGNLPVQMEVTKSAAQELGMTFASAFEDAIVGGKEFSAVLEGLAQDVLRLTVRKTLTEPMANYFSGMIGSLLPGFAVGTDYVPQDMVARIHKGERIIPAAQNNTSASGQSIIVNQYFTVGDVASVSMVRQAVRGSEQRVAASISRSMRYGGALS